MTGLVFLQNLRSFNFDCVCVSFFFLNSVDPPTLRSARRGVGWPIGCSTGLRSCLNQCAVGHRPSQTQKPPVCLYMRPSCLRAYLLIPACPSTCFYLKPICLAVYPPPLETRGKKTANNNDNNNNNNNHKFQWKGQ